MDLIFESKYLCERILVEYMKICDKAKEYHKLRQVCKLFSDMIDVDFMSTKYPFLIIGTIDDLKKIFFKWKFNNRSELCLHNFLTNDIYVYYILTTHDHLCKTCVAHRSKSFYRHLNGVYYQSSIYHEFKRRIILPPIDNVHQEFGKPMILPHYEYIMHETPEGDPVGIAKPYTQLTFNQNISNSRKCTANDLDIHQRVHPKPRYNNPKFKNIIPTRYKKSKLIKYY
jgi:hypothetical protein